MYCAVLLGLFGLTAAVQYDFAEEWQAWKGDYGKRYSSELEELEKHSVWLSNKMYIEEHNSNADAFGYTLAMNHFGDMVGESKLHAKENGICWPSYTCTWETLRAIFASTVPHDLLYGIILLILVCMNVGERWTLMAMTTH